MDDLIRLLCRDGKGVLDLWERVRGALCELVDEVWRAVCWREGRLVEGESRE